MKNGTEIAEDFIHSYSNLEFLGIRKKCVLFESITKNAANLFVKGRDGISRNPLVFGRYEVDTEEVIKTYRTNGYHNFLLDIGANIGLTSCLEGNGFDKIFCFEPNPQVFRILQTNIEITFGINHKVTLNNFGLGEGNKQLELTIPKTNYGGAFLREGNTYSNDILLSKDNITDPSKAYDYLNVSIKDSKTHLNELFLNNIPSGSRGVIKIDVEGYEPYVLKAIAKTLPSESSVAIIFENHDPGLKPSEIKNYFNRDASLYRLKHYPVRSLFKDKNLLKIKSIFGAKGHYKLKKLDGAENPVGQLLLIA
jgi:FkbM family methyltransferase|tara:strand:+ start:104 stop:1030 length:927 start_codon:yes stop_codon:yes gene_type:complete